MLSHQWENYPHLPQRKSVLESSGQCNPSNRPIRLDHQPRRLTPILRRELQVMYSNTISSQIDLTDLGRVFMA